MRYNIHYSCVSHIGKVRSVNQDNFICAGRYLESGQPDVAFPLCGVRSSREASLFGVFDGLGGEECGEVAALIAARDAASAQLGKDVKADLLRFCQKANSDICSYADEHEISSMGTTAAALTFTDSGVTLCNIGDSPVFHFCDGILEQISESHVTAAPFGVKPPLSQSLGIPPDELLIDPYLAQGPYNDGDVYLICSDGLTDMVSTEEITETLASSPVEKACTILLEKALTGGGKDNITIILCKIERCPIRFFHWISARQGKEYRNDKQ